MPRLFGLVVARNEADRYLESTIAWHLDFLDEVFLFDDQSTDGTADIALDLGAVVCSNDDVPAFLQNEGDFRQGAWDHFVWEMNPTPEDWVLAFDADEFFVSDLGTERRQLEVIRETSLSMEKNGAILRIPEVFDSSEALPLVRLDGYWNTIVGTRFFKFEHNGHFQLRPMGCGSAPTYVDPIDCSDLPVAILHYGYAKQPDREAKYQRYSTMAHGHAGSHIESILQPPTLSPWTGKVPK